MQSLVWSSWGLQSFWIVYSPGPPPSLYIRPLPSPFYFHAARDYQARERMAAARSQVRKRYRPHTQPQLSPDEKHFTKCKQNLIKMLHAERESWKLHKKASLRRRPTNDITTWGFDLKKIRCFLLCCYFAEFHLTRDKNLTNVPKITTAFFPMVCWYVDRISMGGHTA